MSKFFSLPIRAQLLLMTMIVALPAAGIIVYSGLKQRSDAIVKAQAETQKVAASIVTEQQTVVACAKQLLSTLAQLPDVKKRNGARVRAILSDNLKINPQFLNIFIADSSGALWASAVPAKSAVSISDRRYFINARDTGRFSSGECIVDRVLHQPALSFGYPFNNDRGELEGVICVNFDLRYRSSAMHRFRLPEGSSCLIVDHRGVIVGRGMNPAPFIGQAVGEPNFAVLENTPDGATNVAVGVDGVKRFSTYRKIHLEGEPAPYMYLRAGIPVEAVYAAANRALVANLCCLLPFLFLSFYLAWLIGKRSIADRVALLQSASQRLAAGDLEVRVSDLVRGGDLGVLGSSFDAMAHDLHREREAFRESENNFRALAQTANDGMLVIGDGGRLLYANCRVAQMLGYSPEELEGGDIRKLVQDEALPRFLELTASARGDDAHQYETVLVTRKGGELPAEVTGSLTVWQGAPASLVIVRDISDRKRAENELRESLRVLQRTFASLNESVLIVRTQDSVIRECNSAVVEMFGYRPEELVGSSTSRLHVSAETYRAFRKGMIAGHEEKGYFESTGKMKRRDGSVFDSEHVVTPIRSDSGVVESYVSVIRDISERKRQEEMLQAKALVLENMAEGVSECDPHGTILFTNPAFDAIFGYEKGELIGNDISVLGHRSPGGKALFSPEVVRHLNNHGVWFGEFTNIKKDGTVFHTYARINVMPVSGNWITVLEDITERQEMERMKDEMISAVSHEMRTPLTALIGYFQVIQENLVGEAQLREYLQTMYKETVRLNELIGNFLDLQRLKAKKALYAFKPLELHSVLTDSVAFFANASKAHTITLHSTHDLPLIIGDEGRLNQVFNNLLSNAIKYSPEGGEIVLSAHSDGKHISVRVSDQGLGIPPEAMGRIFDRFYRVDNTDSRLIGGTGLGLALVREVVDTHGGHVRVESVVGGGSTFSVFLPVAEKIYNAQMIN